MHVRKLSAVAATICFAAAGQAGTPAWTSPCNHRFLLSVDTRGKERSNSPAWIDLNFTSALRTNALDASSIEVVALDQEGNPTLFNPARPFTERRLLPWRLERYYGIERVTLHFVVPNESATSYAVYFDALGSGQGRPNRYPGLVGDGDFFREDYKRREIGAHHFDCFADLDQDGDLDLFKGGVEPFIYVYENVGANRFVDRGRLTSAGELFMLPRNQGNNRSWVVPHFYDWDGDGDQDFFPSFMDGPYAGKVVFFENVTPKSGVLEFADRGALQTVSGVAVAGGGQAGGWFPSVVFVPDFDGNGDGRVDVVLGNNNHCYLYRSSGAAEGGGWQLEDAVALQAGGEEIDLFNPSFDVADVDGDGDWDLFGAPQAGEILFYENLAGKGTTPTFAKGRLLAHDDLYVQPSSHPRLKVADFTGDGLLDFVVDRAWELTDLKHPERRDYGALFQNTGTPTEPHWKRTDASMGAPFTEEFQMCDAIRQNVVISTDWDDDGRLDLLAGDCDGFVWWFRNQTDQLAPLFETGKKLEAGGRILSLSGNAGHARPAVCDWNNDGRKDLVCSDGVGKVTLYLNEGTDAAPRLGAGLAVTTSDGAPIDRGTRSHILVCDWDNDGRKDLMFADQENPGFYFFRNVGKDDNPKFAPARNIEVRKYMRPNFGSFVDWDGDGKRDFIGCEFEHSIRFYRNLGSGEPGAAPKFADKDGVSILKPFSIMMISGADAVDWNGDGDLDILTGQGHGGSGIRYYERDYIDDVLHDTRPVVRVVKVERRL